MITSIYTKTLYQKRWMILAWTLGVTAMGAFTLAFFPSLKDSNLGSTFKDLPPALANLVGDNASFTTASGYISEQLFGLRMPVMTIILAIILYTNLTATDEDRGTLAEQLTLPISRTRVLFEKFLAGATILAIAHIGLLIGLLVTLGMIHESVSVIKLVEATFACWLISMVFGGITFGIGAGTGFKGLTVGIPSYLTFQTYLLTTLAISVEVLQKFEKLSPFYFYSHPKIMTSGLQLGNVIVLALIAIVPVLIGWAIFRRRDLKN